METKKTRGSDLMIILGIIFSFIATLMKGSGTSVDFIQQALGGVVGILIPTFIIGWIPYFILRNKIKNPKKVIFSSLFFVLSIVVLLVSFL